MISTTFKAIGTACVVAAAVAVTMVPAASAKDDDGVRVAGTCSNGSISKLKVKHDDGRIEVEFEADQNRNGVRWNVEFRRNGRLVFTGARTTAGPSGSFSIERKIAGGAQSAAIRARARATRNGEVCNVFAKLPSRASLQPAVAAGSVKLRGDGSVDDDSQGQSNHGSGDDDSQGQSNHGSGDDDSSGRGGHGEDGHHGEGGQHG